MSLLKELLGIHQLQPGLRGKGRPSGLLLEMCPQGFWGPRLGFMLGV